MARLRDENGNYLLDENGNYLLDGNPTSVVPTTTVTTVVPTTTATTAPPTTIGPTTEPPSTPVPTTTLTTEAPTTTLTTAPPTTVAPTTVAPTTVSPTTIIPTTLAPTTLAPTTPPPTTPAPVIEPIPQDWLKNKGEGPWSLAPQFDKYGYLNNKRWTLMQDAIKFSSKLGMPIDEETKHIPCGHWHKQGEDVVPVPEDDLYVLHTGLISGATPGSDSCWKRTKELVEIIHYGTRGSGIDQLKCPSCVTVDDTYVWIADYQNNRIMQRNKSDLTYVQHLAMSSARCVHAPSSDVIWASQGTRLYELNKSDLSTARLIQAPFADSEGALRAVEDITYDGTYIYMVDSVHCRVLCYDAATLTYQSDFGSYDEWALVAEGLCFGGGYLFVVDYGANKVYKVDPSDYSIVATFGHVTGGTGDNYIDDPLAAFYYSSNVYICDLSNHRIKVLTDNLVFVANVANVAMSYPMQVAVDANYIYVVDLWQYLHRFDTATYAYVDSTDIGVNTYNTGMAIDANYIYVTDQDSETIMRIDITTLAHVDAYDYSLNASFQDPYYLYVDATYIYVSDDGTNLIHRINKATMAYVDSLNPASSYNVRQTVINAGSIYVADYRDATYYGGVQEYDLATMALISESPDTYGNEDYWLNHPVGITCDENYLYVANGTGPAPYYRPGEVVIFNRNTFDFVDRFSIGNFEINRLSVDDQYLYVPIIDWNVPLTGYTKKYLKTSPYTEDADCVDHLAVSTDTYYPWYDYESGDINTDDEPQIWELTPQQNKWGYLNNPRWQPVSVGPISYDGNESAEPQIWTPHAPTGFSAGNSKTHFPCGHWHKSTGGGVTPPFIMPAAGFYQQSIDVYKGRVSMVGQLTDPPYGIVCVELMDGTWYALGGVENISEYMEPNNLRIAEDYTAYFTSYYPYDDPTGVYKNYVGILRFAKDDYPRKVTAWESLPSGIPYEVDDHQIQNVMDCYGSRLACVARVIKENGAAFNKFQVKVSNDSAMTFGTTWTFPSVTSTIHAGGYWDRAQVRVSEDGIVWIAYLRSSGTGGDHMIELWKSNPAATSWTKIWETNFYAAAGNKEIYNWNFDILEANASAIHISLMSSLGAGTYRQLIYESSDYGVNFTPHTHDRVSPNEAYSRGTGGTFIVHGSDAGFLRSVDAGANFNLINVAPITLTGYYVDQQKYRSEIVYTECAENFSPPAPSADYISFVYSDDGGATWEVIQTPFPLIAGPEVEMPVVPGYYDIPDTSGPEVTVTVYQSGSLVEPVFWESVPGISIGRALLDPHTFPVSSWARWIHVTY